MTKQILIFLISGLSLLNSCKESKNSSLSEVEIWKLGWRMIGNSIDEKYELASLQFDSLRNVSDEIEMKYLITGLKAKNQTGKNDEIMEILKNQDEDMLRQICSREFLSSFKPCNGISIESVENTILQTELIKMYVDDQTVRGNTMFNIISKYNIDSTQITKDDGVAVDERNRNRLKEIFKEFGFPNKKLVGRDAMQGIFLIIQHSDGDKDWQKSQLPNIEKAVENGDMDGEKYAYLYDRIKINNGEKQLFGTQFAKVDPIKKTVELAEIEDANNLDRRRMKIGMMPIEMYKEFMLKNM
jgi:hypothetical protein